MNKAKDFFYVIYSILTVLIILRFIPYFYPEARLWGFNHIIFLPDFVNVIFLIFAAIALLLPFLKFTNSLGEKFTEKFNNIFYVNLRKTRYRLFFIFILTAIFIVFIAPTHFLGDGYTWLDNLAGERGTIFKWSEIGSTTIMSFIQSMLGDKTEHTAKMAFQIVSVVSGMISIWFYFCIAGLISADKVHCFLIFCSLLGSGSLLLFFGYVEHYPILWPFISGYVYFGLKYIIKGKGLLTSLVLLLFSLQFHLQSAVFVPAFIILLFCNDRGEKLYKRFKIIIWITSGLIISGALVLFYMKYSSNLYFENIFLPVIVGKEVDPDYYIFSFSHILDILNQMLLLSPLLIFYFIITIKNLPHIFKQKATIFLTFITMASLAFLVVIDPKLGLARDWDLFSLSAFGCTLLLLMIMDENRLKAIKPFTISILLYLIISVTPFLLTVLNTNRSIEYHKYIIELDRSKSLSSIITLRDYYRNNSNNAAADSANFLYELYHPNERKINQAFKALDDGNYELAATLISTIKADKFNPQYHNLVSMLNLKMGDYEMALQASDKAVQLRAYDARLYSNRAQVFNLMEHYDDALMALYTGLQHDSTSENILEGLVYTHLRVKKFDSAHYYAKKISQPPLNNPTGFFLTAMVYMQAGDLPNCTTSINYYLENCQDDIKYETRSQEFHEVLKGIEKFLNQ